METEMGILGSRTESFILIISERVMEQCERQRDRVIVILQIECECVCVYLSIVHRRKHSQMPILGGHANRIEDPLHELPYPQC